MRLVLGCVFALVSALALADIEADVAAARAVDGSGDFARAIELWQPLAEQGNVDAQRRLGEMYRSGGTGVTASQGQAILWYRRAADQGDAAALDALQDLYTPIEDPFNGQLVDPRPGSYVLDQANLLTAADRAAVDAEAAQVWHGGSGELMVVTLQSIGGSPPREYATNLFNMLRIGNAGSDHGVLLMVAVADRKAELILGTGLDTPAGRATAQAIIDQHVVPNMRAGNPSNALLAGSRAIAAQLLATPLADASTAATAAPATAAEQAANARALAAAQAYQASHPPEVDVPLYQQPIAKVAGGTGLGLGALAAFSAWWRRRARNCGICNAPMQRLSESADDTHLEAAERAEERVKSVDYDVWQCTGCTQVQKLRYRAFFSGYKKCPSCNTFTKSSTSTTLASATYSSGGRVRVDERCEHCGWARSSTHSTPKLTRSSSSSSRSRGGGGGGGGGGRSSGGGGSGSW